ncbi:MAG: hypothetical protein JWL71_2185 [Acidobacteria bacterium]|nr:hypothetical protein [Acidobacteriota bacterium]
MKHLAPLALFAALAVGWTWPLAAHLRDAVPGGPGDNYSFLWNLWWMRHVLATPGLDYFHTTYLFHPFGTAIANHPHTALPALVAATLLKRASIVTAQNLLLLGYVFANMAVMYALAWDATRHVRASVLAGIVFGLSPYLAVHLLGHFDLVAAWVLPAFALALRRAVLNRSNRAAIAAGAVLAATAYIAYYYVVYQGFFSVIYLAGHSAGVGIARAAPSRPRRAIRMVCAAGAAAAAVAAVGIVVSGGRTFDLGDVEIAARTPQNALTAMWILVIGWVLGGWRPTLTMDAEARRRLRRAAAIAWRVAAVFVAGAAPLLWQAAQLVARGEYVTQQYGWRSVPRGVDLIAPLLGHPLHPLMAPFSLPAYASLGSDYVEVIGWLGIVPAALLILMAVRRRTFAGSETRAWWIVAIAFAVFALGPFLTIAGVDTGLKLPEILLRYVPFAANARMPGRAMVGVYMAAGMLAARCLANANGRLRSPAVQWLLVGLVVFEYWDAPILMTPLDRPAVYVALAAAPPGAVCEVPFGIGDGLSVGIGSQERVALYYATVHEHPLVGGYIGRMPADAQGRYEAMAVAGTLLRLSDRQPAPTPAIEGRTPCRYLVVNRSAMSSALSSYIGQLPLQKLATDRERDLYRVNSPPSTAR